MTENVKPRGIFGMGVVTLIILAVLLSLGFWQLQRMDAKHALMAALDERLTLAPVGLPDQSQWASLNPADSEFRRVTFTATYSDKPDAMVYGAGSSVRKDVPGAATWAFMPATLASGATLVVNAGFINNTMMDRALQDRIIAQLRTGAPVTMIGYLRFPEDSGILTQSPDLKKRIWFHRDTPAMTKALNWGPIAPFYIDLESPVQPNGVPNAGPLQVKLKDNHLQYAITWFGLAITVVAGFGFWVRGRRRAG